MFKFLTLRARSVRVSLVSYLKEKGEKGEILF